MRSNHLAAAGGLGVALGAGAAFLACSRALVDEPAHRSGPRMAGPHPVRRLPEEQGLQRDVRLEVTDWHSMLSMVQSGVGISYGPAACIDLETFDFIDLVPLAGAPTWELGVVTQDDGPCGAASRAFLAAYLRQCRGGPDNLRTESGRES